MLALIKTSIGTKFSSRWSALMCRLALKAVRTVTAEENGRREVDIKRYARVEKVPGGEIEQSEVLDGVMLNKDVTHPKMRRRIENPRIVLLDCSLEYKKGESQTNIEFSKEGQYEDILRQEEEQIKKLAEKLISFKPDLIFTEKGISGPSRRRLLEATLVLTGRRRLREPFLCQGGHHEHPTGPQVGQQPHSEGMRRDHRQPGRGPARQRHRDEMRPLLHRQARRRVRPLSTFLRSKP